MGGAARFILSVLLIAVVVTVAASITGWWLAPARRTARALARLLGVRPDAVAISPEQSRGLGISARRGAVGLVRFAGDPGSLQPFAVMRGVELMLDGEVRARAFRGEGRRPLDRIDPGDGGRVTLRLAMADLADPTFEIDLWRPADRPRPGHDPARALAEARAAYARLETIVQTPLA